VFALLDVKAEENNLPLVHEPQDGVAPFLPPCRGIRIFGEHLSSRIGKAQSASEVTVERSTDRACLVLDHGFRLVGRNG
jgi:hypothetical protein